MEEAQQTLRRPQNLNREFTHVVSEDHPKMSSEHVFYWRKVVLHLYGLV